MENEQKRTQVNKETMIEALEVSLGIVTEACNKTGLSRTQHYKSGSVQATTFFLRTRGRKRGYNEKQEIDLTSGDERIKININLDRENK